ncbi:MAG: hypothetical protein K1W24_15480 [Lachnospiraceae bacterium]
MLTLKQLIIKENAEMKERRKKESIGCYYIFYLFTIFYTFTLLIISLPEDGSLDKFFIYHVLWTGYFSISFLYGYLYKVKENGKFQNIFIKYKFIPVDINKLFLAKFIILSRHIILQALPAQILAVIFKLIYICTDGGKFLDIFLFIPVISSFLFCLIFFIIMYQAKQAAK